jgi:hypothetical protein
MFSLIFPFDMDRLCLFQKTLNKYKEYGVPDNTEFIIVTRHKDMEEILMQLPEGLNYRIIQYTWDKSTFNPSLALNLGVKNATYDNIIITCPEVLPISNVLQQLSILSGKNILCQCYDEAPDGSISMSLVNSQFRSEHPGMYFLAMFQKEDIEKINGWDENFMNFYAHEDVDFGHRFNRAGLKFEMHDEIEARHQYHIRGDGNSPLFYQGLEHLNWNDTHNIIRPKMGMINLG